MPLDADTQRRLALLLQQSAPGAVDETGQPMPAERSGIASLLMSLRGKIPENPSTGFSAMNMMRGALEHGANSFDTAGLYRDPSQMTAFDAPMPGIVGTAPRAGPRAAMSGPEVPPGPMMPETPPMPALPEHKPSYATPPLPEVIARNRESIRGEMERRSKLGDGYGLMMEQLARDFPDTPPPPRPEPRAPRDPEIASAGRYDRILRALNADKAIPRNLPVASQRMVDIEIKKAGATTPAEKIAVIERLRKDGYLLAIPAAIGLGSGDGE